MSKMFAKLLVLLEMIFGLVVSSATIVGAALLASVAVVYTEHTEYMGLGLAVVVLVAIVISVAVIKEDRHVGAIGVMISVAQVVGALAGMALGHFWLGDYVRIERGGIVAHDSVTAATGEVGAHGYRAYMDGTPRQDLQGTYVVTNTSTDEDGETTTTYTFYHAYPVVSPGWSKEQPVHLWVVSEHGPLDSLAVWRGLNIPVQGVLIHDFDSRMAVRNAASAHKLSRTASPTMISLRERGGPQLRTHALEMSAAILGAILLVWTLALAFFFGPGTLHAIREVDNRS